ncbi:glycoside hydrolase family 30 beta sandwich domain-containing protein [uncultured Chitinophaga sp.]|jgi:O-Glycosyl hydrolase|uniref:glycoside hydrolase family 30 protein n=1 Tax=uncultured Chitinophaga sp. TaxID=339340 RepID=UPI002605B7AA|nr:glycoside hydrolase family 30 beta sandwich domain-containing protein [uncultured Chitinophaga sp.]
MRYTVLLLTAALLVTGCAKGRYTESGTPSGDSVRVVGKAQVWVTNGTQSKLLQQGTDIDIKTGAAAGTTLITIDASKPLQEIEGFGAALTGSSAYLIHRQLNNTQRSQLLQELFDPGQGIGISYLRLTMGASDFSLEDFTYDDMPPGQTDPSLANFSIVKDKEDIVPVLQAIRAIAPDLKIMGSPWSAPAWMKDNGRLAGGRLKPEWYGAYAGYFVKYIQAYRQEGIRIDAVTPQNEPLYEAAYPSMRMEAAEQAAFIREHLGPAFRQHQLNTAIVIYDHNWDVPQYPITILNDTAARQYVTGAAFHAYAGEVTAMTQVHAQHPDKALYFTEVSGGAWAQQFADNLEWNMANIFIGSVNNWSRNALLWNLALDDHHGPQNGGCKDCRGVVTIGSDGAVTRNVEYYAIGHMSRFIRPGAFRISLSGSGGNLDCAAFLNSDATRVLVVLNKDGNARSFTVREGDRQYQYSLEGNAVATIVWK